MGDHYLKAYRTTKMGSGKDDFLYEDYLDAVLAIIDADMFKNDEDMESVTVTCIKNLSYRKNCSFKCEICPKVCLSKVALVYQGTRKQNINSPVSMIVSVIVILAVRDQDWNLLISV